MARAKQSPRFIGAASLFVVLLVWESNKRTKAAEANCAILISVRQCAWNRKMTVASITASDRNFPVTGCECNHTDSSIGDADRIAMPVACT